MYMKENTTIVHPYPPLGRRLGLPRDVMHVDCKNRFLWPSLLRLPEHVVVGRKSHVFHVFLTMVPCLINRANRATTHRITSQNRSSTMERWYRHLIFWPLLRPLMSLATSCMISLLS